MTSSSSSSNGSFDILQLPSIKQGMTKEEEADKRVKTCRFLEEASRRLKLPQVAKATAMVFFHRFYAKHSFQEHDRFEVAVASLVLAAKVEESPKRVDKVISECVALKNTSSQSGRLSAQPKSSSAVSPKAGGGSDGALDQKGEEFMKLKERILLLERIHLHTIGFDLFIEHPYKFIVEKVKSTTIGRKLKYKDGTTAAEAAKSLSPSQVTQKMSSEIMQYSVNFANDALFTSLCLQFGPEQIATASLFMACCYADIEPTNGPDDWMEVLDHPNLEALVSICEQVLDMLDKKRGSDVKTNNKIRAMLDVWRGLAAASSGIGSEDGGSGSNTKHSPPPNPSVGSSPKRMKTEQ